jgi:predicted RNA-binding protein Jag
MSEGEVVVRIPANLEYFQEKGTAEAELQAKLFKLSQGQELYYQSLEPGENGEFTMYGFPRTQVLDRIYELAYPVIKILDDRAQLKVKSNRAVTDFFVIVQTRRSGNFIGKHGTTLDAAETLIAHTVSRQFPRWVSVTLDVDNYRRKRQAYLENLVRRIIRDIERDHRERRIPELLPKERKFIHQYLTGHPYLTTESRGTGANRMLYILPRTDIREI